MKRWWSMLAPRERLLVGWGGAISLVLLYILLIWQPLRDEEARLLDTVARQRQVLALLEEMAPEVARLRQRQPPSLSGVREGLQRAGLTEQGVTPEGKEGMRIKLAPAPFAKVTAWLATLEESGVVIGELHVRPGEGEGVAGVELVINSGM